MRSQIALDWIVREQESPNLIHDELNKVNVEIDEARRNGSELRFLKEKRDILLLASYQLDVEINTN
jgi:LIX1-like protein